MSQSLNRLRKQLHPMPLSDLLDKPLRTFGVDLNTTHFSKYTQQLTEELRKKGLKSLNPHIYIGDEWFSPNHSTSISVPFFLLHPKLRKLEKEQMGEVEGGSPKEFMQLLRHETGHCLEHALKLTNCPKWKKLFGSPRKAYSPEKYSFERNSLDYVLHLKDHYAQCHPVEDFAETFAVWLNPKSQWRTQYSKSTLAYQKLLYVDDLVRSLKGTPLPHRTSTYCHVGSLNTKLKTYYRKRKGGTY